MPEIKNNFLGSKMNKDIDDRLMPNNEYRNAINLQVNRSENSDIGALQNVLGNSLAVDFNDVVRVRLNGGVAINPPLQCIGVFADDASDDIYVFLTNNSGTAYNPAASNYVYVYNNADGAALTPYTTNPILLISGAFLNFSTQFPIYGINLVEKLLFWTDNRNQPRKINVQRASTNINYYTNEEQISVAKLGPLDAPELFRESEKAPGEYETTMYDVVSPTLPNGTTPNPYLPLEPYPGDPAYLESRYVRFSYRYKFEDGEYSIMAPFTQIAYIPKQDGYFLYSNVAPTVNDEESTYRSTIVSFMQNKVNNILLQIRLPYLPTPIVTPPSTAQVFIPCPANELNSVYKITEIEILYKEADAIAVSVVDSIPTIPREGSFWNTTATVYSYNYQSKKPFKTLPERDVIRVNDITPARALSQEVVGNRVVYGNYQDKFSYPKYLDYNVGVSTKFDFGFGTDEGTSIIEYPNHSVKQNRNYQVGVVLCDKFSRQSGVILSDVISGADDGLFGASSLYLPYISDGFLTPSAWPGYSLKILFNSKISPENPNVETGWPGLYNGDQDSDFYNPLGWYSYKIVVKQTEQDYYNVYFPGVMAAYPATPTGPTLELGKTSHAVLINDNINKVPRDLSEVGPAQKQFRSSVILYPRVNNNIEPYHNEQYYPGNEYAFASTIATATSLFYPDGVFPLPVGTIPAGFEQFYQINSDPLISRLSTVEKLGVTSDLSVINLAIYETKPIESKLDIYWETSTTGLISDLNTAIELGSEFSISSISGWEFYLLESAEPDTNVSVDGFAFRDVLGDIITPTTVEIVSVVTLTDVNVTSKFVIDATDAPTYKIKTAPGAYFYYGINATNAESYIFTLKATIGSSPVVTGIFTQLPVSLTNVAPLIDASATTFNKNIADIDVFNFSGVNGSNPDGGQSTENLTWTATTQSNTPQYLFTFSSITNGLLQDLSGTAEGTFLLRVNLFDAGNLLNYRDITVIYPSRQSFIVSGDEEVCLVSSGTTNIVGTIDVAGDGWEVRVVCLPDDFPGGGSTNLELTPSGGGSVISVDVDFIPSFPPGVPVYSGWTSVPPGDYSYQLTVSMSNGSGCGSFEYRNV